MPDPGPLKRTLYPPSSTQQGQSPPGDDVVALKRAISRAGFWKWQTFSDDFTNGFAHGDANGKGVAGFQRSVGIDGTGTYGAHTHDRLRTAKVPKGAPHEGEDVWDQTAVNLYKGAGSNGTTDVDRVRKAITSFCEQGIGEPDWYYSQARAIDVSISPNGPTTSDCSGSVIQAFYYAKKQTGIAVPDPSMQSPPYCGYGNTNYYEDDHPKVTSGQYLVGDLAHYDGHVCLCYHAGDADSADWWSFGSEPPSKRKLHYRTDFRKVVRPPLVP